MHFPSIDELVNDQKVETTAQIQRWIHHDVFSWQWWIMIFIWIGSLLCWWKFADKKRITELLLYSFICAYLVTVLDAIGTELGAWAYGYKLAPLFNRLMPVDIGVLPVLYTTMYQLFKSWRAFIMAHSVMAFLLAFIVEPLVERTGVYVRYHWNNSYSFPIYIAIPIVLRLIMVQLRRVQKQ